MMEDLTRSLLEVGKNGPWGDPGMAKVNRDIPDLDGTEDHFESWQKPCLSGEMLAFSARTWHQLPSKNEGKNKLDQSHSCSRTPS